MRTYNQPDRRASLASIGRSPDNIRFSGDVRQPTDESPAINYPRVRPISLQKLRDEPKEVARRVQSGEELIVYRYSEPIFRLIRSYDFERSRLRRRGFVSESESVW